MKPTAIQFLRIAVAICMCPAVALLAKEPSADEFSIGAKALSALRDPVTSESDFFKTVAELGSIPSEPASTWLEIVGDRKYSDRRRKLAFFEFVKRHVRSRMTLFALARLIPKNELFINEDIDTIGGTSGPPRPPLWDNNGVYFIKIKWDNSYPSLGIYIVLSALGGDRNERRLLATLRGEPGADFEKVRILDVRPSKWGPSGGMPP